MSKITLLVYAFACKQLTNIVSNGQPNDPRPKGGLIIYSVFLVVNIYQYNILNG